MFAEIMQNSLTYYYGYDIELIRMLVVVMEFVVFLRFMLYIQFKAFQYFSNHTQLWKIPDTVNVPKFQYKMRRTKNAFIIIF